MSSPIVAGTTIVQLFENRGAATQAVTRLRSAGFADVRISERTGETARDHVAPELGLTQRDFAETLSNAGFEQSSADSIANAIADGKILIIVPAAADLERARAVLLGHDVRPHIVAPIDSRTDRAPQANLAEARDGRSTMNLREERLEVAKEKQYDDARIRRETITEDRTITVPVSREELVIDRDGTAPVRLPLNREK